MTTPGLLETFARILGEALGPLETRLQGDEVEDTLAQLGLRLPTGSLASGALPQALQASAAACAQLPSAVAALIDAISGADDDAMISAAAQLAQKIIQAGAAFTQLATALNNVVQAAGGLTAGQKAKLGVAAQEIPNGCFIWR